MYQTAGACRDVSASIYLLGEVTGTPFDQCLLLRLVHLVADHLVCSLLLDFDTWADMANNSCDIFGSESCNGPSANSQVLCSVNTTV